ncbi:hypothetical protein SARC_15465 [Sphaeroforma arctica JP610]|uniref:Uncharacterized protein n=1 Tax=Sphaeroforma arctica JP610 TaxID=667725 RepID=A0A0L0F763_9EUKA|nr:hypothetical protein SARC_15465 [Sphaeroforma arctica JP610]KNC71988.1 hypothetical protein SARC_15465 [Sphaeroforma arctica JP610]|eukprot:XP_014145890.1 hypothetical protein SARC_15465 [Sphaeroforma arctica JP610]
MNDKTTSELQATIAATQSAIDGVLRKMNGELVLKERLKMKEKALMALAVDLAMGQGIHVSDDDLPVSDLVGI